MLHHLTNSPLAPRLIPAHLCVMWLYPDLLDWPLVSLPLSASRGVRGGLPPHVWPLLCQLLRESQRVYRAAWPIWGPQPWQGGMGEKFLSGKNILKISYFPVLFCRLFVYCCLICILLCSFRWVLLLMGPWCTTSGTFVTITGQLHMVFKAWFLITHCGEIHILYSKTDMRSFLCLWNILIFLICL